MAFNLSAASAVLKFNYLGPVREQLNLSTPLLAELQRKTEEVVGKQVYLPLHVNRSEAVGARADGGTLPTANSQGYAQSTFNVTYALQGLSF